MKKSSTTRKIIPSNNLHKPKKTETQSMHPPKKRTPGRINYYLNLKTNNFDQTCCTPQIVLGFNSSEIKDLGLKGFVQRIHPDDIAPLLQQFQQNPESKDLTTEIKYRFIDKYGSYQWVRDTRILLYQNKNPKAIIGTIVNLTDENP